MLQSIISDRARNDFSGIPVINFSGNKLSEHNRIAHFNLVQHILSITNLQEHLRFP